MNKHSELIGSGGSRPNFSKSLLDTINTGFDNTVHDNEIISNITLQVKPQVDKPKDSILDTLETGFGDYNKVTVEKPKPELIVDDNTIHICNGDCKQDIIINENIVPNVPTIVIKNECDKDSILNSMESGFGAENTIVTKCKKPIYKTHLCKESYLGEFKSETEKQLARQNLGVYSKEETHLLLEGVITNELENLVKDLDYTTSRLKSYANYQIPNNLFN